MHRNSIEAKNHCGNTMGFWNINSLTAMVTYIELYTGSVFFGRYRPVFLGIYHTDTEGKLGRYFQCRRYEKVRIYSK